MTRLLPFLVAALFATTTVSAVHADEGAPATSAPQPIALDVLAQATLDTLPEAPARFAPYRVTYEPGASPLAGAADGPLVVYVEAGGITARADEVVEVARADDGHGHEHESDRVESGADLALEMGDRIVVPAGAAVAYANAGREPAAVLVAAVLPAEASLPGPTSGVAVQSLASGVAKALPAAPATLILQRVTVAPGVAFPAHAHPGPMLSAFEAGGGITTIAEGEGEVTRGLGMADPAGATSVEPIGPQGEAALAAGDAAFSQLGTAVGFRNPGPAAAVFLSAVIHPLEATHADA